MQILSKLAFLLAILIIVLSTWIVWTKEVSSFETRVPVNSNNVAKQQQSKQLHDPCWFRTLEGMKSVEYSVSEERSSREWKGYPTAIPLVEAVKIFNQEQNCYSNYASLPALTEEEVIAAAFSAPDYDGHKAYDFQKEAFRQIIKDKMMPKGSLLVGAGGCKINTDISKDEICIKGRAVYLLLGLDKDPRSSEGFKPGQVFTIRKTFFGIDQK